MTSRALSRMTRTATMLAGVLSFFSCSRPALEPRPAAPTPAVSGAPAPTGSPAPTVAPAPAPSGAVDPASDETFGPLRLGLSEAAVLHALGPPASRSEAWEEGASGLWLSTWKWPAKGVSLVMESEAKGQPSTAHSIQLAAPSALKNVKGIGVGSRRAAVVAAFGPRISTENAASQRPDVIVVGSIYGGVVLELRGDEVVGIFVGASAE